MEKASMTNIVTVRPYVPDDKADLITCFELNTPKYFDPKEKADFIRFLDHEREFFYTALVNDSPVGCMGYKLDTRAKEAKITWAFIHPAYHGHGMGKILGKKCLGEIKAQGYSKIMVRTSQLAYRFFEKFGFETIKIEKDFWGKGLDLYLMKVVI